ncbi:YcnI family protein [Streptacidiphilus sp. ASG 303]|uniref:YcnI family copper-binding membrane protein n=1 Tax=Streptacidiphilus sp. ASG 303 TaxID=2896847 RepID=UPI001E5A983D|nr:YcnI family protein [Streptacidiphilus sp. ASG 303]MCD0482305.1 YcnI family protein [Streptacidiphilus sp. ASG 303]
MNRRTALARRSATVVAAAATAVLAAAGAASAHVSVNPDEAVQGSYTKVAFRVPNERDDSSTTRVEVDLPKDHPVASVSVRPLPGWTAAVEKSTLDKPLTSDDGQITEAVTKITWTADKGARIGPGQFQEFDVSLGPLPADTASMVFKALQTYADGQVVRWIDVAEEGKPEPEHPAPTLALTKAAAVGGDHHGAAPAAGAAGGDHADGVEAAPAASGDDSTARALGVAGIVVGVVGAGLGVLGLRRRSGSAS